MYNIYCLGGCCDLIFLEAVSIAIVTLLVGIIVATGMRTIFSIV